MKIEKKPLIFISTGVIILAIVLLISYKSQNPEIKKNSIGQFITREVISKRYEVPEIDTVGLPDNIARPTSVLPARPKPGQDKRVRFFNLSIEKDKFFPDTIIINDWDDVLIYVKAVDKDYDFTQPDMGVSKPIPKGQTAIIKQGFGETKGVKLTFYCASCGGPLEGPRGQILTVPRPRPQ